MSNKSYPEFSSRYPLTLRTIMQRPALHFANKIGVVYRNPDTGRYFRFTWDEWYQRTSRLANALKNTLKVKQGKSGSPGDRIGTMALNHHRHLELYYAAPCIGATLHPINMRLSQDHMAYTINHAGDKVLFFDDEFLPLVEEIYDRIKDTIETFVYISDEAKLPVTRIKPLYEYEELLQQQTAEIDWPYLDEDTCASLTYTTGTTGQPKGVTFTHRQLYLETLHVTARLTWNADPKKAIINESAVPMFTIPMFHVHGWAYPFIYVFGATKIAMPGRFTPDGFCELVQSERVNISGMVPTMLVMLVEYPDIKKYDLSSLQSVMLGAAPITLGLKARAEELMPQVNITASGYGMTELAPATIGLHVKAEHIDLPKKELDQIRVKVGLPEPGLEVRIVDENGKPIIHNNEKVGEIIVRGPWVTEAYYKNPEKTAEVWRDGWFHTGDVAKIDKDGYITIADRITDVIRSGAEMVPTMLLENLTTSANGVLEATYIGVPDDKWGEVPMAVVRTDPKVNVTEDDIFKFLQDEGVNQGKITRWMLPVYITLANEIPKTSVGKYNKVAIKQEINRYLANARKMR